MTQEEKYLVLKDLCARLTTDVIVTIEGKLDRLYLNGGILDLMWSGKVNYKPYLRPLSSMTEEEKEELRNLIDEKLNYGIDSENEWSPWVLYDSTGIKNMIGGERFYFDDMNFIYDWLNAHHFDYRGLIEKGLALEASEDMY